MATIGPPPKIHMGGNGFSAKMTQLDMRSGCVKAFEKPCYNITCHFEPDMPEPPGSGEQTGISIVWPERVTYWRTEYRKKGAKKGRRSLIKPLIKRSGIQFYKRVKVAERWHQISWVFTGKIKNDPFMYQDIDGMKEVELEIMIDSDITMT